MAVCTLAVILMGIPIAMVVSPLLLGAATLVCDVVNLFTPAPNVVAGIGQIANWLSGPNDFLLFYAIIALPGVVLVLVAWASVRRLLLRGGVGGLLLGLGARPQGPRPSGSGEALHMVGKVLFGLVIGVAWAVLFGACLFITMMGWFLLPMCLLPVVGIPHLVLRNLIPWLLQR